MSIIKKIMNWNWKRITRFVAIGIFVPFATIGMWFIDKMTYDVNILTDIHYLYLVQINILLWIILYYILGLVFKKEKSNENEKVSQVRET